MPGSSSLQYRAPFHSPRLLTHLAAIAGAGAGADAAALLACLQAGFCCPCFSGCNVAPRLALSSIGQAVVAFSVWGTGSSWSFDIVLTSF